MRNLLGTSRQRLWIMAEFEGGPHSFALPRGTTLAEITEELVALERSRQGALTGLRVGVRYGKSPVAIN